MHGEAWVNTAIQEADLLLAFGMRFDDRVTGNLKTYAPKRARSTSTSTRPKSTRTSTSMSASSGDLGDVSRRSRRGAPRDRRAVAQSHRRAQGRLRGPRHPEPARRRASVRRARHQRSVARSTDGKRHGVTDVGQHQMWEAQYYHHESPRSLITSGGLGTMGFALPAAIGAKIARPDAEVWVIVGDGGFQMTMAELATIAQEKINMKVAIINNGYLGMVRQWQEFFYERRYAATPLPPRFREACRGLRHLGRDRDHARRVVGGRRGRRAHSAARSSTSSGAGRLGLSRWCRPAPICTR